MKGWYIPSRPGGAEGETTAWFASFWGFCRDYLSERFGEDWALTPEQSLVLHAGNQSVPRQLLVRAKGARNRATEFIHGTSLFEGDHTLPAAHDAVAINGLRVKRRRISTPIGVQKGPPSSSMLHEAEVSARTVRVSARSHWPVTREG